MTLAARRNVSRKVRSPLATTASVVPARVRATRVRTSTREAAMLPFPTPATAAAATSVRAASSSWEQLGACAMIAFFLVLALFG
jgi:hypothetical protein